MAFRSIPLHYTQYDSITLHTLCYVTLLYIILHCTTVHYIATLRYVALQYIVLHCTMLHYITLRYAKLHYIILHYITFR